MNNILGNFLQPPIQNSKVVGERLHLQGIKNIALLYQIPSDAVSAALSRLHVGLLNKRA